MRKLISKLTMHLGKNIFKYNRGCTFSRFYYFATRPKPFKQNCECLFQTNPIATWHFESCQFYTKSFRKQLIKITFRLCFSSLNILKDIYLKTRSFYTHTQFFLKLKSLLIEEFTIKNKTKLFVEAGSHHIVQNGLKNHKFSCLSLKVIGL